jgi:hypothetical protein
MTDFSMAEAEFAALLDGLVADEAPRLFAVVQEYGPRVDGRIAAWGMAFPDRAEIISVDHRQRLSLVDPYRALRLLTVGHRLSGRLVWTPAPGQPPS